MNGPFPRLIVLGIVDLYICGDLNAADPFLVYDGLEADQRQVCNTQNPRVTRGNAMAKIAMTMDIMVF